MITASNLTKHYGEVPAVQGVDFEIATGQVVGLLGPNGAGKTTTMRLLTTSLPPTAGTASVAGFDVRTQAADVRKHIGYLPETPPLYRELDVRENLQYAARLKGIARDQMRDSLDRVIERCGLAEVQRRLCGQLSKGFRQRVGLAAALVHNPDVIILDEPTSGLDPAQILEIRELITELRDDHTVILSTHVLPEVVETCSQVIIIHRGRIVEHGSIEELTAEQSLEERFLRAVMGSAEEAA